MNNTNVSNRAMTCFDEGYNCAESLIVAFNDSYGSVDIDVALATPFGAGLGGRRDLCGMLIAGVMLIGHLHGRVDPADMERKTESYKMAGAYYRWFKERFGSVMCRDIVPGKFLGHTTVCEGILKEATAYLAKTVVEPTE